MQKTLFKLWHSFSLLSNERQRLFLLGFENYFLIIFLVTVFPSNLSVKM